MSDRAELVKRYDLALLELFEARRALLASYTPGELAIGREDYDYGNGPIFLDEYEDLEWKELVIKHHHRQLTSEEGNRYIRGPRNHPFVGFNAYMHMINGRAAAFRDEESYLKWKDQQKELSL